MQKQKIRVIQKTYQNNDETDTVVETIELNVEAIPDTSGRQPTTVRNLSLSIIKQLRG